jgi:hypothetical protein
MDMSGQLHAPVSLAPGKELPVPVGWEAEWAEHYGEEKIFDSAGIQTSAVQLVARRYTDIALPDPVLMLLMHFI